MDHFVGQRLSLKGQACSVRYNGPVSGKAGRWLGVEWDDTGRGKHDGSFDGTRYFECRSTSHSPASFIRPSQSWDQTRTFLEALQEKYISRNEVATNEAVYFSSKPAEEIGFEKFAQRQAQLQGIFVLVLDRMQIKGKVPSADRKIIASLCSNITELDLGGNLFENLDEVADLCSLMPNLKRLVLDGNRFANIELTDQSYVFGDVRTLSLSNTLLQSAEISHVASHVPRLSHLIVANNELTSLAQETFPNDLRTLDLAGNLFTDLADLEGLSVCSGLKSLILKRNHIGEFVNNDHEASSNSSMIVNASVQDLDLAYNSISTWSLLDALHQAMPAMTSLRVTGNPLYKDLKSPTGNTLATEDGYMLTVARLTQLQSLNYSRITAKDRLNSETYYLSLIATELSLSSPDDAAPVLMRHPRWNALCEEYGEPAVARRSGHDRIDPNSLAARLVQLTFIVAPRDFPRTSMSSWVDEIPKSANIYLVLGAVGRKLSVAPLELRLVWLTGEQDPRARRIDREGIESWDSSDDESDEASGKDVLVAREVELLAGTRALGTYIEGDSAQIRVEMMK